MFLFRKKVESIPQNFKKVSPFGFGLLPMPSMSDCDVIGIVGLPGSGKTAMATKILMREQKKNHRIIFTNDDYENDFSDYSFKPCDLGKWNFPNNSLVFIDEMSLNGYDSRNTGNFKNGEKLDFWKKHRQETCPILWTNQTFTETDIKVREALTTKLYFCHNYGFYCSAKLVHKSEENINQETGRPDYKYYTESFLYSLFHAGERIYCIPRFVGKHYKSVHPTPKMTLDEAIINKFCKKNK